MTVLVVGISHRSAPIALLEQLAIDRDGTAKLVEDVLANPHVTEATAVVTCNRLEIYAAVDRFHGSVEDISQRLLAPADGSVESLLPHLYVHYDDGAVSHLFRVAAGLDSMAVGEAQVLGQTRAALTRGQEHGTVGPTLNSLFQQALRVGKRVHAETDVDHAAPSLVSLALQRAVVHVGALAGKRVLVVGAGSMAALAVSTLSRLGVADVVVASRTEEHARRLAEQYDGRAVPLAGAQAALADADLLVSCTGATGVVLPLSVVAGARVEAERPLAVVDLALPHDVDPSLADLPGVELINLAGLADELRGLEATAGVDDVRTIVGQEISAFLAVRRQASVTPTVVALRSMATSVVDAEMERLSARLPGLDDATRAEVLHTVRRVADKLLHEPTVRVKELADAEPAVSYTAALAELFRLDPDAVDAVTRPEGLA